MTEEASREEKCPRCGSYTRATRIDMLDFNGTSYFTCSDPWHKGTAPAPAVETPKEKTMANENEVNDLGYPLWPVDSSGTLVLTISIRVDDATKVDRGVMNDPLIGAITEALKPLFSNLPCVNLIEEKS